MNSDNTQSANTLSEDEQKYRENLQLIDADKVEWDNPQPLEILRD